MPFKGTEQNFILRGAGKSWGRGGVEGGEGEEGVRKGKGEGDVEGGKELSDKSW